MSCEQQQQWVLSFLSMSAFISLLKHESHTPDLIVVVPFVSRERCATIDSIPFAMPLSEFSCAFSLKAV